MSSEEQPLSRWRFASIRSSLSSIYQNYDFHFDIIKMTGIIVLLSLLSTTLVMTNSVYKMEKAKKHNKSDCIHSFTPEVTFDSQGQWNETLCDYMKQFPLPEDYYVTVCLYQKTVRIDFRKFINGKPTILGFYLKLNQWNYLKRLQKYIDLSIKEIT